MILHLENSIVLKKKKKKSLPESRKSTWKICVHTTAWETWTHFFWDFKRRQGGVNACSCLAVLLGVPAEPQSWAPHSLHLEQEGRSSAPSAQEQHSIPEPRDSEGRLHCPTAAHSASEKGKRIQLPLVISRVLCSSPPQVPSQDTLGAREALGSDLQSILTLSRRDRFSRW